jgi:hypothetical protein
MAHVTLPDVLIAPRSLRAGQGLFPAGGLFWRGVQCRHRVRAKIAESAARPFRVSKKEEGNGRLGCVGTRGCPARPRATRIMREASEHRPAAHADITDAGRPGLPFYAKNLSIRAIRGNNVN